MEDEKIKALRVGDSLPWPEYPLHLPPQAGGALQVAVAIGADSVADVWAQRKSPGGPRVELRTLRLQDGVWTRTA